MATSSPSDLPKDYIITGVHVLESKLLGEGAYGVVKLGKYYGLPCAVKKLKASMFPAGMQNLDQQTEIILQSFYNECDKLSKIRHPNVVQLLGVFADKKSRLPVIVMELMHESLSRLLYRRKTLPFYIEVNILHDVAQALAYLHSFKPAIVHRDLSSNNILLSEELRAKITDLGVAKVAKGSFLNWDNTPAPGTLVYMPPEVRKVPADLTPAMDVFALGINAIQIRTHKFPRPGPEFSTGRLGFSKMVPEKDRRKDHLDLIGKSHPLKPIILDCLKDNPRDRPTALQLCERLEKLKETGDYLQNHQTGQLKDSEKEATKRRISELEEMITQLKEELAEKNSDVTKLQVELERERNYTAQLLEANTREKLKYDMQNSVTRSISDDPDTSKKARFRLKLKKLHKSFRKSRPSNNAEAAITGAGSVSSEGSRTGDEIGSGSSSPSSLPPGSVNMTSNAASAVNGCPPVDVTEVVVENGDVSLNGAIHNYKMKPLTWYSHHCLPQGLHGSTLRVHEYEGRLYVCSGATNDSLPNKALFHCSIRNLTRWVRADPDVPQYYSASAIVQGEVVLISGLGAVDGKCTGSLSSYDNRAHVWVQRFPPLPTPRSSASAIVYGDYLIVLGGQNDNGEPLNIVEVLHIPTQTWETASHLPIEVAGASVVACGDMAYLVGGCTRSLTSLQTVYCASIRSILASCRRFFNFNDKIISRGIWKQLHDCPFTKMTALCSGNQLLAFGGEEVTKAAKSHPAEWIWCYDSEENTWTPVQGMPTARKLCCVTMLPNNNMVIIGGEPDFTRIDIAEIV